MLEYTIITNHIMYNIMLNNQSPLSTAITNLSIPQISRESIQASVTEVYKHYTGKACDKARKALQHHCPRVPNMDT